MSLLRNALMGLMALAVCTASPVLAQTPAAARGRLLVTVNDPSGAVIPNATVTVTPEPVERAGSAGPGAPAPRPAATSEAGVATIEDLAPGRYTIVAAFPGFETVGVKDFRLRAGDNRRTITLPIRKVAEDLVVGRDGRDAGLDPRGNAFSTVLTREQIEALPDDPDEMEAALKAMAPPGAQMRIDGFSGGKLPPKSQIRSIRLPRMDQLAAQNHGGFNGLLFIDIMTQPGNGPLRGSVDFSFRDDALNARNPFAPAKGDEGLRQGGFSLAGTVVPNRSSFSVSVQNARLFDTETLLAAVPDGTVAEPVRRPTDRMNLNARFDQALGQAHMMRASFQRTGATSRNLGVGGFDLPDRAFETTTTEHVLRLSENGAVGRRFFSESRLQVRWSDATTRSAVEAPTVRVLDAFTDGGAQRRGGRHAVDVEAASDLDYVRGAHSMRAGVLVEGGRYRADDTSNDLGTYTFASLADYEAGRPSNYTRRVGDPSIEYSSFRVGAYAQDDYRVHKSLLLSFGLRYEAETLLDDHRNFSPRVSVSWSPFEGGRTTFRGGWGWFSDWLPDQTYEQVLRVDGVRQQEINVQDPSFPDAGTGGVLPPTNWYRFDPGLDLPTSQLANVGVDQTIGPVRLSAVYTRRLGSSLLRGRNRNAPVDGIRPDPSFANIVEVTGDAASRANAISLTASLVKLDWRQTFVVFNYGFQTSETNTTGAFGLPANGDDLSSEWGPMQPRHRYGASFNMRPWPAFGVAMNVRGSSGAPYDVTTGRDDNGDGVFNDRPDGVARNSAIGDSQWDVGIRLSWSVGFGERSQGGGGAGGGTVVIMSGGGAGGGMPGGFMGGGGSDKRYRLEFYASAQNVTNHRNYVGYSGVLTSPFFGVPTNVLNPRKIEVGVRVAF
ncbi:MAG: TonB-dependent receptor [Vicinamibacterales bacterium]